MEKLLNYDHDCSNHDHSHHDCCCSSHDHKKDMHNHHEHMHNHHEHDHHCNIHSLDTEKSQNKVNVHGRKIYKLENLGCPNCAAKMERKILNTDLVKSATIDFASQKLILNKDFNEKHLEKIEKICQSIEPEVKILSKNDSMDDLKTSSSILKDILPIVSGSILFALGFFMDKNNINNYILIYILSYIILSFNIFKSLSKNIFSLKSNIFDENFLMIVATLGAFAIKEYPEAIGVMLFFNIGEFFEHKAVENSRQEILNVVNLKPQTVNLLKDDKILTVSPNEVNVGDTIVIKPGEIIPLDCKITKGSTFMDTSAITGESLPLRASEGDVLNSGYLNTSNAIEAIVEKTIDDSLVTRIMESMELAAENKPKIDRFITRFARYYTPFVVILAVLTAVIPSLITGNWNYWIYTALTFLVISCPCALVLSVPLAFFAGMGLSSKKGILFKGGLSIERLKSIKAVAMDKTGTVTLGDFSVQEIYAKNGFNTKDVLSYSYACENLSNHPIAKSIISYGKNKDIDVFTAENLVEIPGKGIKAYINSKKVLCGNEKLLIDENIKFDIASEEGTIIYLAIDNTFAGYILISDTLKDESYEAVKRLKDSGKKVIMLTGDAKKPADDIAKKVGFDNVYSELLPDEKMQALEKIRTQYGPTMFIGDGINDAAVLSFSDVGAAMGDGSDAAIEASDLVFMTSNLNAIDTSFKISDLTTKIAIQNVVFALIVKFSIMVLGFFSLANMWAAVFADTGVAIICILNSVRILRKKI